MKLTPIMAIGLAASIMACDKGTTDPPQTRIVFSRDIQPVFRASCATSGCHAGHHPAEDFDMETWQGLFAGSHHGAMIVPYRADKSHLVYHINRDTTVAPVADPVMPPGGALSREVVARIMRWIDEGAANDDGTVAFTSAPAGRVYVTNQAEDMVAVIDRQTDLVARFVRVGSLDDRTSPPEAPHNVVVDAAGTFYYVNMIASSEIWKLRTSDNTVAGRLTLTAGSSPAQVVLSADGSTGYVSNLDLSGGIRRVQVFSTGSMQVTKEYSDVRMWASHGVQLSRDGRYLWTCNQVADNLAVIDLQADTMAFVKVDPSVPDVPVNPNPRFGPYQMVFSPDGAKAFVTCRTSNEVRVFDTAARTLTAVIPVGVTPLILDITPDGRFVYVANRGAASPVSTSVTVIDAQALSVVTTIQGVGPQPHGVAVTPDGRFVYVSTENVSDPEPPHHPPAGSKTPSFVAVIEVATQSVLRKIEVGAFGAGVTVTP